MNCLSIGLGHSEITSLGALSDGLVTIDYGKRFCTEISHIAINVEPIVWYLSYVLLN